MRRTVFIILVICLLTAGCVGQQEKTESTPTPTPTPEKECDVTIKAIDSETGNSIIGAQIYIGDEEGEERLTGEKTPHTFHLVQGTYWVKLTHQNYETARSKHQSPGIGTNTWTIPMSGKTEPTPMRTPAEKEGTQSEVSELGSGPIRIQAFEMNPPGSDLGEWIELYNPTDEPVTMDGWVFETGQGKSKKIPRVTISPHSTVRLRVGDPTPQGFLVNEGDGIMLKDSSGALIDVSPASSDTDDDNGHSCYVKGTWTWCVEVSAEPGEDVTEVKIGEAEVE